MCINIQTKKNPKFTSHPLQPYYISYPCGKCPLCIRKRLSNWIFRIQQEQKRALSSTFITLTYDDNNLPHNNTANKRDIQLFHKRLRKYRKAFEYWDNYPLRYLCVSEYGTRGTKRPHYHIIAFNYPDNQTVEKIWGKGFISQSNLTEQRIKYTLKYISKPNQDSRPTFQLTSQGIGSNYLSPQIIAYHNRTIENCYITKPDGFTQSIPKYYKTKLYSEENQLKVTKYQQERIDTIQAKQIANLMNKYRVSEEIALQKFELSKLNSTFKPSKNTKL